MLLTLLWILPNGTDANLANYYTNLANYYRSALIELQLMPALLEAACSMHEEVQIEVRQIASDYIAPDYIASDYIAFDYT